ncbi:hypothetical protein RCL1_004541 [Eukaryota sp. TZLM3-RCL]
MNEALFSDISDSEHDSHVSSPVDTSLGSPQLTFIHNCSLDSDDDYEAEYSQYYQDFFTVFNSYVYGESVPANSLSNTELSSLSTLANQWNCLPQLRVSGTSCQHPILEENTDTHKPIEESPSLEEKDIEVIAEHSSSPSFISSNQFSTSNFESLVAGYKKAILDHLSTISTPFISQMLTSFHSSSTDSNDKLPSSRPLSSSSCLTPQLKPMFSQTSLLKSSVKGSIPRVKAPSSLSVKFPTPTHHRSLSDCNQSRSNSLKGNLLRSLDVGLAIDGVKVKRNRNANLL